AGDDDLREPWDLVVDPNGTVFVIDSGRNLIVVLGPNGERRGEIGAGLGMFHPRGIAQDPSGNLVVADTGGNRVLRLRPNGELITALGGRDNDLFNQPTGVAVDNAGNFYVVEPESARITRFGPDGQLAASWPVPKADTRVAPRVAITENGLIGTVIPGEGRLEVVAPTGQVRGQTDLRQIAFFSPVRPFGLAIREQRAAIIDWTTGRVGILDVAWPGGP
ncbi:MAG TPA: NHL repeat-containing protein, partial [Dehalococcoidia bacterium]|nr:NHL repeat-containing protein [Dehalococcoidia bacterium]